jgi:hypothetical protein
MPDDSERSYGYSRDIYHGRRGQPSGEGRATEEFEESYEYGPEGGLGDEVEELSPEEQAIHIEGGRDDAGGEGVQLPGDSADRAGSYDYSRSGLAGEVESFTWNDDREVRDERDAREADGTARTGTAERQGGEEEGDGIPGADRLAP